MKVIRALFQSNDHSNGDCRLAAITRSRCRLCSLHAQQRLSWQKRRVPNGPQQSANTRRMISSRMEIKTMHFRKKRSLGQRNVSTAFAVFYNIHSLQQPEARLLHPRGRLRLQEPRLQRPRESRLHRKGNRRVVPLKSASLGRLSGVSAEREGC